MRFRVTGLTLLASLALFPQPALTGAQTAPSDQPDFPSILQAHGHALSSVTSDEKALGLFSTTLGTTLDLADAVTLLSKRPASQGPSAGKGPAPSLAASDRAVVSQVTEQAARLTSELAAWHLAKQLQAAADAENPAAMSTLLPQMAAQRSWLLEMPVHQTLGRAVHLMTVTGAFVPASSTETIPPLQSSALPNGYADYAVHLDRAYPRLVGADESWLSVAERDGTDGIRRRLMEPWNDVTGQDKAKESFAAQYFVTHLRPVLMAHVVALAIRAEVEAERQARDAWSRLRTWRDRLQEVKGLARLCGTWHWTLHNHQNHQDHKMVVTFPPPSLSDSQAQASSAGSRPTKIVVLGGGVYLRWEFQGGYQEDSLLFAGEGQRLEGTFVNSAGAWGSITGKRAAPCPRER